MPPPKKEKNLPQDVHNGQGLQQFLWLVLNWEILAVGAGSLFRGTQNAPFASMCLLCSAQTTSKIFI